jgi:SHS2 domain-containing protein
VYRWVEHTAELELEIEAASEAAVFGEALEALAELVGDGSGPPMTRELEVAADERAVLLVEWLSELVYLAEAERFVPERIDSLELGDGRLRARVEGHRGEPRHLVKAVTLHRLEFRRDDTVGWRARVVLDV